MFDLIKSRKKAAEIVYSPSIKKLYPNIELRMIEWGWMGVARTDDMIFIVDNSKNWNLSFDIDFYDCEILYAKLRPQIVFGSPGKTGDYEFFSNFSKNPVTLQFDWQGNVVVGDQNFPLAAGPCHAVTSEHLFQALKAKKLIPFEAILNCKTPQDAKKLGGQIELREDWEKVKFPLMVIIQYLRFRQNISLQEHLLKTGMSEIIEDARLWDDCIWGIGKEGCGSNLLGLALMIAREHIRNETKPDFSVLKKTYEMLI